VVGSGDSLGDNSGQSRHHHHRVAASRHDQLFDALRTSLWFRPGLWMLALAGLALGLVALDTWLDAHLAPEAVPRLLRSNPDDARALLGAIVGAMLTVVSLAFSVVMIAVVQMSNAYSPRLLRLYIADVHNQHVLGILLGTFLYSLLVLRSVRQAGFAPTVATNVGVLLAVVSTVALVAFLHHVPQSIKVDEIIRMILAGSEEELDRAFPSGVGVLAEAPDPAQLEPEPQRVIARRSGYIQIFDLAPLADRDRGPPPDSNATGKAEAPLIIRMHWRMGDFVLEGTTFASVWGRFDAEDREALGRACVFGTERTMRQDPRFGIEQLTDVALRALSPGINDPTTASAVINALTVLFAKLVAREDVSNWRSDTRGRVRIEFRRASFAELIELSYLRVLRYGAGDQQVVRRLIGACEQLYCVAEAAQARVVIRSLLEAIHSQAGEQIRIAAHRQTLDHDFARACAELDRPLLDRLDLRDPLLVSAAR
jgi:uncharacterized membrane protein